MAPFSVEYLYVEIANKEEDLYEIDIPLKFTASVGTRIHGLACWFDVLFNGRTSFVFSLCGSTMELLLMFKQHYIKLIQSLLVRIGQSHPQALMYPLLVACKSISNLRKAAAQEVVDKVRQHSGLLVDQAQLVSVVFW
ncbi:unnamed protein product [Lactuca virosa]|uniref:Uncharacterized protein n=1 Tax=Lactuca virosa TaxID=75947 RepID=A0AAU9MAH2_9ASTR|nr:unnamed protein product [Lactuca virosa]